MATGPAIPLGLGRRARALSPGRAIRLRLREGESAYSCARQQPPSWAPSKGAIPTTFSFIAFLVDNAVRDERRDL